MFTPSFREFVQKVLHLVDGDGCVARITQTVSLGDTLKDVGEIVDQLGKCDGHPLFDFGCRWLLRVGGGFSVGTGVILFIRHLKRFLQ